MMSSTSTQISTGTGTAQPANGGSSLNSAIDPSLGLTRTSSSSSSEPTHYNHSHSQNSNSTNPPSVSRLALTTPKLQSEEDGSAGATHQAGGRVLEFNLIQKTGPSSASASASSSTSSTSTLRPGETKTSSAGAGGTSSAAVNGLAAAFEPEKKMDNDKEHIKSPPLSTTTGQGGPLLDLVKWLQANYVHSSPPYTAVTPHMHRDELYAHVGLAFPAFAPSSLPSKDQISRLVVQAFPSGRWENENNLMRGLVRREQIQQQTQTQMQTQSRSGSGSTSSSVNGNVGGRHRYTTSCNLSDLAAIAAIEQESMNGSEGRRSQSQEETEEPQSPPAHKVGIQKQQQQALLGTPRRSALDELAAAAALSERSPMAAGGHASLKGRRDENGGREDGPAKKRRIEPSSSSSSSSASPRKNTNKAWDPVWAQQAAIEVAQNFSLGMDVGNALMMESMTESSSASASAPAKPNARGSASTKRKGIKRGTSAQVLESPISSISQMVPSTESSQSSTSKKGHARSQSGPGASTSSRSTASQKGKNAKKSIYTNHATTSPSDPNVKHYKPNFTYHELITHEIKRSFEGRLQLSEIYRRIAERYPYFKLGEPGWQNSIRHNLSLKKCFVRVDRPSDTGDKTGGKGGWWTYVASTDIDGRPGRKGTSGKGTGEYRKGSTPSDIASRSPTPEAIGKTTNPDGSVFTGEIDHALWTRQHPNGHHLMEAPMNSYLPPQQQQQQQPHSHPNQHQHQHQHQHQPQQPLQPLQSHQQQSLRPLQPQQSHQSQPPPQHHAGPILPDIPRFFGEPPAQYRGHFPPYPPTQQDANQPPNGEWIGQPHQQHQQHHHQQPQDLPMTSLADAQNALEAQKALMSMQGSNERS